MNAANAVTGAMALALIAGGRPWSGRPGGSFRFEGSARCAADLGRGLADVQPRPGRLALQSRREDARARPTSASSSRSGGSRPRTPKETIGVVHATPTVVAGEVYFGTATFPAFYKLAPDGTLRWVYRNPVRKAVLPPTDGAPDHRKAAGRGVGRRDLLLGAGRGRGRLLRRHRRLDVLPRRGAPAPSAGRSTAARRAFPGAHWNNLLMASPILADGKVIFGGGTLEQLFAGTARLPRQHRPRLRRGARAEDRQGRLEVRRRPEAGEARPAGRRRGCLGQAQVRVRPRDEQRLVHAVVRSRDQHALLRHRREHRPAAADARRPEALTRRTPARSSCARRRDRQAAVEHADQPRRRVDQRDAGLRPEDRALQGPVDRRHAEDLHASTWTASRPRSSAPAARTAASTSCGPTTASSSSTRRSTPARRRIPRRSTTRACWRCPAPSAACRPAAPPTAGRSSPTASTPCGWARRPAPFAAGQVPTGGRVTATSVDLATERWRHERPKIAEIGGTPGKPMYRDVGDIVASGIAVANGVAYFTAVGSGKLIALDAATGTVLKEIDLGPVFAGPSVSRGRVYVGGGNTLCEPQRVRVLLPQEVHRQRPLLRLARGGRGRQARRARAAGIQGLPMT